jgi:hypothetical protein
MGPFIPLHDQVPVYDTHTVQRIVSQVRQGITYDPNGSPGLYQTSRVLHIQPTRQDPRRSLFHQSHPKLIESKSD